MGFVRAPELLRKNFIAFSPGLFQEIGSLAEEIAADSGGKPVGEGGGPVRLVKDLNGL